MTLSHSPEPWSLEKETTRPVNFGTGWEAVDEVWAGGDRNPTFIAAVRPAEPGFAHGTEGRLNAERIVACVNACEGLTAEQVAALPVLVKTVRAYLDWGAMTGSDRDLFESAFSGLLMGDARFANDVLFSEEPPATEEG